MTFKHLSVLFLIALLLGLTWQAHAYQCGLLHNVAVQSCEFPAFLGSDGELPAPDTDGDGIPNSEDACPTEFSLEPSGCQSDEYDSDGDGLPDDLDWCPYLSLGGVTSGTSGCPGEPTAQDPDADGVIGDEDQCPEIPGSARADGCIDNDGDGVRDSLDSCPRVPGLHSGCPEPDGDGVADDADRFSDVLPI